MRVSRWFKTWYPDDLIHFCCYCGKQILEKRDLTREHLIPKSKGGNQSHYNLKACCRPCNGSRGNQTLEDWLLKLKFKYSYLKPKAYSHYYLHKVYKLEAVIENVEYWIDYIKENHEKLYIRNYNNTRDIESEEKDLLMTGFLSGSSSTVERHIANVKVEISKFFYRSGKIRFESVS